MFRGVRARAFMLLAGALLAGAGVGASGVPAHAAPDDCSVGAFCVHSRPYLVGEPREFFGPSPDGYVIDSPLVIARGTAVCIMPSHFGNRIAHTQWHNCS